MMVNCDDCKYSKPITQAKYEKDRGDTRQILCLRNGIWYRYNHYCIHFDLKEKVEHNLTYVQNAKNKSLEG